jgi:Na+-translocating ferredoxin:NAD+ oxidoreductase RnfG subunit
MTAFLLCGGSAFSATRVYQKPSDFVKASLGGLPSTQALQLTAAQQNSVSRLLGKRYKTTTIRYWTSKGKTAYILAEIGKVEYITVGISVKGGKIEGLSVLVYRETHGMEVARTSFTKQFKGVSIKSDSQLTRNPPNIAGATLSVRALTKLARLALYLETLK